MYSVRRQAEPKTKDRFAGMMNLDTPMKRLLGL